MKYEIKNRWDGKIIYQDEAESFRALVLAAINAGTDLRYANLSYANLSSANLSSANLSSANLSSADLRYANLSSANLSYANLSYANLSSADLRYANLSSANLRYANFSSAELSYADLSSADLSSADLSSADLSSADLSSAELSSANLSSANLSSANLHGYFSFGPGGSRNSYTWARWEEKGYMVHCGCQTLTLNDFEDAVKKTHKKTFFAKWYLANIETMRLVAKESESGFRKVLNEKQAPSPKDPRTTEEKA